MRDSFSNYNLWKLRFDIAEIEYSSGNNKDELSCGIVIVTVDLNVNLHILYYYEKSFARY